MAPRHFRVALTGDFYQPDGSLLYRDIGLNLLDQQHSIAYRAFAEHRPEIDPAQLADVQGVIVLSPRVTVRSVSQSENLLAVGRFGVGYDTVDVEACTAADVALVTTVGAVDRPVAEATVGWMLALTHHMRAKDRLVREGRWAERSHYMGIELRERTLGIVGLGGIGRKLVELLSGFGMQQPLAFDPFLDPAVASSMGVRLVTLDELMSQADFVSVHCPLNDKTRNLIGARELALMKPTAYLINTARGGIINEDALYDALAARHFAGAAIDCFLGEPLPGPHRLSELENVILAPHSIAWTDEMFRDMGRAACQAMIDWSVGRRPRGVVNAAVLERPGFQAKWARLRVE